MKDYDYSTEGGYFVTMCVQNRECLFGEIVDSEMKTNRFGEIVRECWDDIPKRYQNVAIDEFVVMPDHVHGIIIIEDSGGAIHELPRLEQRKDELPRQTDKMMQRRQMLLPKIIGRFKMNSAKRINEIRNSPGERVWQRDYYEHVIRNEGELIRIREYISNNPARWLQDEKSV
ncbi:MAG TPA: transposase [Candidatus Acidoferrales bacterium]|nr:transposase [Candidatus Acidoferrales bacterium]